MQIGPHKLNNPWILAPMAGVSEMPYRVIVRELGASAAPTELVSAKGLIAGQARTERYMRHSVVEKPFWVQIFGGDPDTVAQGAWRAAEMGAHIIDVNMGCPVRKVTRGGAGSALLCDPKRAADIVAAVSRRTGLPVTAKIRAGWDGDSVNCVELSRALADAGCAAITMHARTRVQGYSGAADWRLIRQLVLASSIPVLGNGDIANAGDARRMMEETGCSGVMIGRGALGNPWIFENLASGHEQLPAPETRWATIQRHFRDHLEFVGEELRGVRSFRKHLQWYAHGLGGAERFVEQVVRVDESARVLELGAEFFLTASLSHRSRGLPQFGTAKALG